MSSCPGPPALGRGVIVACGHAVPPAWSGAPVVVVDAESVASPAAVVTALHDAWASRRPVVVSLAVDPGVFRDPVSYDAAAWELGAEFEPLLDRLHFLVWANNYDARADPASPVWWWARKAARLGAVPVGAGQDGDVLLPGGGGAAWIDGGPRSALAPSLAGGLSLVHRESVELGSLAPMPAPRPPSADLAPDQLAAVGHGAGPARIIAPAGSGKTRVLTERVRHLLRDRGYERQLLLAVAYNKKAQEEMEDRTRDIGPRVRTLNALGYRLLGLARGGVPRLLDEREVRRLIERFVPIRRQRANTDPVGPYLEALGLIRLGLRDPEEVEDYREDVPGLAAAFDPYRAALAEAGAVDFDEQIYGCVERLLADGAFRRRAQGECRHLLVDEFQDLTPAHVLMLRLLAAPQLDVFGVGDDDQVIYGHAGADPGFLIGFERLFPGAASHPLEVNYRCPEVVVRQACDLLSYNQRRVPKVIRPGPSASPDPAAVRVVRHPGASGADALVGVVGGWLDSGVDARQVAVLTRVNALLMAPQVALRTAGVPVRRALGPEVLERTGLRAALAYVRLAAAHNGRMTSDDLIEILRRPSRGLPPWFSDKIRRRSWWTLDQLAATQVPEKDASKLDWLVGDLTSVVAAGRRRGATTASVLAFVKDKVGLGGAMGLLDSSRGGEGSSHLDDLDALEQVAGLHPDLATFDRWLREQLTAGDGEVAGVTLATVHRVKGREWDHVAVFGVNAGILPHRLAEDAEEERRVLHVAVTRCRRQVVLLSDESRPSPMLAELSGPAPPRPVTPPLIGPAKLQLLPAGGDAKRVAAAAPGSSKAGLGAAFTAHLSDVVAEGNPAAVGTRRRRDRQRTVVPEGVDPVIEQALRTWRSVRSRKDKVPAYVVLHDATLQAIAAARPSTLVALRHIDGIGPAKLELYGEDILALLAGLEDGAASGDGPSADAEIETDPGAAGSATEFDTDSDPSADSSDAAAEPSADGGLKAPAR